MKKLLILTSILLILCGCNFSSKTRTKLILIDSLLYKVQNDSAMKVLKSINAENLKDESNRAYYNLLMTQTRHVLYMTPMPDSIINGCIEYYTKQYDAEKLAKAYYYKGAIFYEKGNNAEAITALKNGEIFAKKAKNKNAIHHIAELLAFINLKNGNYNTALKYAHIALNNSIATNNKSWIVEDLNRISAIFAGQSKADSSDYYMNEALKKTKDLPQK